MQRLAAQDGTMVTFLYFSKRLAAIAQACVSRVTFKASIATKLPADNRFVSIQQLGDLSLIVSCFQKGTDLISFNLAAIFVDHGQLRLAGQEDLNANHSQPPSLQLIKVAIRA